MRVACVIQYQMTCYTYISYQLDTESGVDMNEQNNDSAPSIETLKAEIVALIDDPVIREEWLNSPIPILDSRCPKSYLDTASDRERLMRVLQEMKYGETA